MNYATTPNPYQTAPDNNGDGIPDILKDMAQFAVNMVDRMDPDNVMTKFEFDINLADGWGLDDDPYTDFNTSPTPGYPSTETNNVSAGGERGVVYGVEEQQLALNEAQIIYTTQVLNAASMPQNHNATEYDDTKNRDFTYIELENVSRQSINFGSESWQIVVRPPGPASGAPATGDERRLTFTQNHPGINWGSNSIYLVGAAGDAQNVDAMGNPRESEFRVNRNYKNPATNQSDPNYDHSQDSPPPRIDRISPRGAIHMDLILQSTNNLYRINQAGAANAYGDGPQVNTDPNDPTAQAGADLFHLNVPPTSNVLSDTDDRLFITVEIELRRRVNPLRQRVTVDTSGATDESQSRDNPWIVVDRISVPLDIFYLRSTDEYNEIRNQMNPSNTSTNSMRTYERRDPLIRNNSNLPANKTPWIFQQTIPTPNLGHWKNNSLGYPNILGNVNYVPPGAIYQTYSQYQPLFNRDYGSAMELLEVPLYGPDDTTKFLAQSEYGPGGPLAPPVIAADMFLHPKFPITNQVQSAGNRWYRLFEFVEVPDRSHRHPQRNQVTGNLVREPFVINVGNRINNAEQYYRKPGRINLNTLRYPEVLGGLLDDPEVAKLNLNYLNQLTPPIRYLADQSNGTGSGVARDWWIQFVAARDGIDPVTNLYLPGLPTAKPFLPFSYSAQGVNSIQNTLLRTLPYDLQNPPSSGNPRTLFELGNQGQTVDHSMKYRMLEKMVNNTTVRSNVFIVFMQVDFFEAAKVLDSGTGQNVVRVGAKLQDSPGYRGFFVIDRSRAKSVISSQHFGYQSFTDPVDGNPKRNFNFDPTFNFSSLILHRQTIN